MTNHSEGVRVGELTFIVSPNEGSLFYLLFIVAVRLRPLATSNDRCIQACDNTITILPHQKTYTFDDVFDTNSTQEQVFQRTASDLIDHLMNGNPRMAHSSER